MAGGPMDRRSFLGKLPLAASAAAGAGALLAGGCAGATFVVPRQFGSSLAVPASAVRREGVFVAHPRDQRPIFLARSGDGMLTAVHARCTHRGCQPDIVAGRLVCPCHGSEFAADGAVLEGPAGEPLRRYAVTEDDGMVLIHVGGGPV